MVETVFHAHHTLSISCINQCKFVLSSTQSVAIHAQIEIYTGTESTGDVAPLPMTLQDIQLSQVFMPVILRGTMNNNCNVTGSSESIE